MCVYSQILAGSISGMYTKIGHSLKNNKTQDVSAV